LLRSAAQPANTPFGEQARISASQDFTFSLAREVLARYFTGQHFSVSAFPQPAPRPRTNRFTFSLAREVLIRYFTGQRFSVSAFAPRAPPRGSHRVSRALFGVSPKTSRITHLPRRSPAKAAHASRITFPVSGLTFSASQDFSVSAFPWPVKS
jgi:hypothetical protein